LIPNKEDRYRWKILPGKEHLFEKHMSKQSKGIYMELWREVGVSFEAVLADNVENCEHHRYEEHPKSFSEKIRDLTSDNTKLQDEICQWRQQAEVANMECNRLQTENQGLMQREAQMIELINRYKTITMASLRDAYRAFEDFIPSELGSHLGNTNEIINYYV